MRFSLRLNNDLTWPEYVALPQTTERIEIGSGVLNPYTIHPADLAMFAATMDDLSGNRFNLGLAADAGEFLKTMEKKRLGELFMVIDDNQRTSRLSKRRCGCGIHAKRQDGRMTR